MSNRCTGPTDDPNEINNEISYSVISHFRLLAQWFRNCNLVNDERRIVNVCTYFVVISAGDSSCGSRNASLVRCNLHNLTVRTNS